MNVRHNRKLRKTRHRLNKADKAQNPKEIMFNDSEFLVI